MEAGLAALHPENERLRRVLMTADTVGGVWTYALELSRALAPHGVEVVLATMGARLSADQRAAALRAGLEVHESDFKLEWMEDPWDDVSAAGAWLLELEARLRPNLVHLNGYAHGSLPWAAPSLVVGHSCVLSWWRAVKNDDAPARWDRYAVEVRSGLQAARAVAAPTAAMLGALERHYGPLAETAVIPNGRSTAPFVPLQREKAPFILAAGRLWDEAKNLQSLAGVAAGLPWPVYLAGDAAHPNGARATFDNVRLLGHLPQPALAAKLARASIYALPARYEPFGLSALEAGLAGCALVLGDIASLREVWGEAALFVAPDDTEALHRTLTRLIEREDLRREFGKRAYARAREYSPERMAAAYLQLYRQLLKARVPA